MTVTIRHGDCREVLRTMPDQSVHCCVTSPPYFGLRDYGVAGQIGLEPTPEAFVNEMVSVFREVRRVLRDDGTLWLNLGDSYCSTDKWGGGGNVGKNTVAPDGSVPSWAVRARKQHFDGIKPKDLIGVPWMVAFALRADGWYLRQDIIWNKPNPMPESVQDRCTKAHEYLFLLSKSARYHYDASAIREDETKGADGSDFHIGKTAEHQLGRASKKPRKTKVPGGWDTGAGGHGTIHRTGRTEAEYVDTQTAEGRNKRSVWAIPTFGFSEAHFATFPPALVEPCIKAGCPAGGVVLDPFGGSGTTGMVADRLQRDAILIELNPEYAAIAERRLKTDAGMFASVRSHSHLDAVIASDGGE